MREGKNVSKKWKRITAFLLVSAMLLSSIPGPDSIAADNGENVAEEGIHTEGGIFTEYDDSQSPPDNQEPFTDPIEGESIPTEPVLPETGTDEIPTDKVQPDDTFTDENLPEDNLTEGDETEGTQTLVFEDGSMKVTATAEAGVIPADTFLQVIPVVQENAETLLQYQELEGKLQEKAALEGYSVTGFLAYDITFVNAEGLQIEPNGDVAVTIEYSQAAIPTSVFEKQTENNNVTLMYLERYDDGQAEVIDMGQFLNGPLKALDLIADNQVARAEFSDSRASLYTFVWSGTEIEETPDEEKNENLDGEEPLNFLPMTGKLEIIAEDVVLRAEPSIEGEIVEVVPAGTYLELLGMAENETESWYKALYEEAEVYVRSDMAKVVEEDASEKEEEESEDTPQMLEYENDSVKIAVSEVTEGAIPKGASLRVVPLEPDNASTAALHQEVQLKLEEKAEGEEYDIAGFLAYDITFVNENGEEVEPNGYVKVTMEYLQEAIPEEVNVDEDAELDVTVMHLEENGKGNVKAVVDMVADTDKEATVETTEDVKVKKAEFVTDSFSAYTITWTFSNSRTVNITAYYGYEKGNGEFVGFTKNATTKIPNTVKVNSAVNLNSYTNQKVFENDEYSYGKSYYSTNKYSDKVEANHIRIEEDDGDYFLQASKDNKNYKNIGLKIKKKESRTLNIYYVYNKKDKLTEVTTVDHISAGITMRMIDMEGNTQDNYKIWTDSDEKINLGGGYNPGSIKSGLLESVLGQTSEGSEDRYPVSTGNWKFINGPNDTGRGTGNNGTAGQNLSTLFAGGTTVNHLFRKDILDSTGYYEYSSFENYAYLGDGNEFTVYNQIGTPSDTAVDQDGKITYFYKRGNFMPYNPIEAGKFSSNTNLYDENGKPLDKSDDRFDERLYLTQGTNNYQFGMYMAADFIQPKEGKVYETREKMRYEFNGDDDLWVYIDNVLVLDIGGVHDAHSGYIDFATGEVGIYDSTTANYLNPKLRTTSIKAMFEDAGVFPDGEEWDDAKVNDYFTGDTFNDFSLHSFKMFYMERGAGASNLHMKFNLQVVPEGQFEVTKRLTNTDKENYTNVDFAFQVFAQQIDSIDAQGNEIYSPTEYVQLSNAIYKDTGEAVEFQDATFGEGEDAKSYSDVFYLKPDQTAVFSGLKANRKYYVVEVGVNAREFDKIIVNGTEYKVFNENEQIAGIITDVKTDEKEVADRPIVICENNCSVYNSRELRITKRMAEGQSTDDTFSFKIQLTDQNSSLTDYVNGNYYLVDSEGYYYYYDTQGQLTKNEGADKPAIICGQSDREGVVAGIPAGYTVVITQILSGTGFLVQEVGLDSSVYSEPIKAVIADTCDAPEVEGADGTIVLGKNAEVTITNTKQANNLSIKKVDADDNAKLLKGAVFELQMWDGQQYTAVIKNNKPWQLTTDETGLITFTDLENGNYKVVEITAPEGYVLDSQNNSFEIQLPYANDKGDATITVDESSKLDNGSHSNIIKTFTNKRLQWEIIKRSINSEELLLPDAEFTLSSKENTYYGKSQNDGKIIWYDTNTYTNMVEEGAIIAGTYTLSETKAPAGYEVSTATWTIRLGQNGAWISASGIDTDDQVIANNKVTCYFENTPIYVLPSAGGTGIYWYSISGLLLMLAAALILYKNRYKGVLKS